MALTQKQKAAIAEQTRKNIAKRAATQRTKISASEARTVSNKMNKRPGATKQPFIRQDVALLSKSEKNTLGATSKANAAKEKFIQKNRSFAKGEGKLPTKQRVGTKAEYKQFGKDIEMRKQLIARAKVARASQAARAANPAPAKATTLTKAVTPVAAKKKTPSPKTKPSTAAIKERTVPNTKTLKKAVPPKARTLKKAVPPKDVRPKKMAATSKLQTLEEAKASAPKPRGPMLGPEKPSTTLSKPAGKIASKVSDVKKAASSTKVVSNVKAVANTSLGKKVIKKVTPGAKTKFTGKVIARGAQIVQAGAEAKQIVSGQAEKDFRRIQALENRIAVAKGQKPKYTTTGTNKNLLSSVKTDLGVAAKIVSGGLLGKTRKDRLAELKTMATKVGARTPGPKGGGVSKPPQGKKPTLTKGSNAPATTSGNKYRVNAGDTLSGIASRAGVSLKDLRSANPQITDPRKIYRNTGVVIPKSGKVPTGGYTKKAK
jgi:LysM repeat protein